MPVSIVTDSVASLPADLVAQNGIEVVPLYVNDGERNQIETEMDLEAFYRRLADMRTLPTSSQPSVEAFLGAFRRAVERGGEVLGVFVSAKMSGTYETARMAAEMVTGELPAAVIDVFDSGSNSMQEGYAVLAAAAAARAGETIERCKQAAAGALSRTRYLFSPASLEYLRRGGRIGGAAALIGGLLQIKPILTVERGETQQFARARTQTRALAEIARHFADDVRAYGLAEVCVHYIADRETAAKWATEAISPIAGRDVRVIPVSPVIGLHVGPAIGIVYETEREWT